VKPYWVVFGARFRALLQYRAAALAGVGTQLFWGVVRMMIFAAFYRSSTAPQPMTYPEVVTYIWLGQAMLLLVIFRADPDVKTMIDTGSVAYELARPLDLYTLWFFRALASRTAPVVLRIVPVLLFAGLLLGLQPPDSPLCALLWVVSTAAAAFLSAALSTLLTVSLLWTLAGEGINRMMFGLIWFLSGIVIPLPLFPDWLQPVLNFLPFRGLLDTPFRIYMNHIPTDRALLAIGHQLAWTVVFVILGRAILGVGKRRLVVQGG